MSSIRGALLCVAAAAVGAACADLAMEPNQIPHSLVISPEDARVKVGDVGEFSATVLDEDGQAIPGPPSWAPAEWEVADPTMVAFEPGGGFTALDNGEARIGARTAGLLARTTLLISPSQVLLRAPAVYLNQAVQNLEGSVPLIAGRKALLRVFVTGDEVSYYEPRAYADFIRDGEIVHTAAMGPPHQISDAIDERWLYQSFNAEIPGEVIQPGVSLVVQMDPDGVVPLKPGSQPRIPAEGTWDLNVTELPVHYQTIVPVIASTDPGEQILVWSGNLTAESQHLHFARSVLPIWDMELTVHEPYYSSANLSDFDGWIQLINEIRLLRVMEDGRGYYYGAFHRAQPFGIAGLGYVGYPVSIGLNDSEVLAHEVGHNLSLFHAPCGGAGGPDEDFPYGDGSTGVWGYDPVYGGLFDPGQYKDLMGYCDPNWVSDYSFIRAMDFRIETEIRHPAIRQPAGGGADDAPAQTTLLLWGSAVNGRLWLEPAFLVKTRPVLAGGGGPYRLEGFGAGGRVRFSFDFRPTRSSSGAVSSSSRCPTTRRATARWSAWSSPGPRASSRWARGPPARWRSSRTGRAARCARFCATGAAASIFWTATRRSWSATVCPRPCGSVRCAPTTRGRTAGRAPASRGDNHPKARFSMSGIRNRTRLAATVSARLPRALPVLPVLLVLPLLPTAACDAGSDAAGSSAVAFEGARVIVGDGTVIEDAVFVVDGGRFAQVGAAGEVAVPDGAARVELAGRTVMPAIVNAHFHLDPERAARTEQLQHSAYYGAALAVSLGLDEGDASFEMRDEVLPDGARSQTAGRGITSPEPGRSEVPHWVTTEDEARAAVRELAAQQVDIVKIWVDDRGGRYERLSPELYGAVIDEAHANGLRVTAHVFRLEDAKGLLRAGVDAFAHGIRDMDVDDELVELWRERPEVVLVPNLPGPGVAESFDWLSGSVPAERIAEMNANSTDRPEAQEFFGIQARNMVRLHEEGFPVSFGTDGGSPWAVHQELADMVRAGMTPADVIVAATSTSAEFVGAEDLGTIEAGKSADFIVLDADPLDDIANTRAIGAVYLRGAALDREGLGARFRGAGS